MGNSKRFSKNDDVYILDNKTVEVKVCIHGVVEEIGEETVLIKWDDLPEETEYNLSDLPDIQHKEFETGHDVRFTEIQKLKTNLGIADNKVCVLRDMLKKYVLAQSRMLQKWADGDELVKNNLWKKLHSLEDGARELIN